MLLHFTRKTIRMGIYNRRVGRLLALCLVLTAGSNSQAPLTPHRRTYQHTSMTHAMATIERIGRETGLYDTWIRTDTQLITRKSFTEPGIRNLNDFDAIFFFSIGEPPMTSEQKADLLALVHEDGKGFVAAHTGNNIFFDWDEFGEMIGGRFDDHPWELFDA